MSTWANVDTLPLSVVVDLEGVPLTCDAAHAEVRNGLVFGTRLDDQQVAVLTQVGKPVFLDDVFERNDREGIFGELGHGSGSDGDGWGPDKLAGELPAERVRFEAVPVPDEGKHLLTQIRNTVERAVAEHAALQDRKPDFDLIDPRRVKRCVNEAEAVALELVEFAPAAILAVVVHVEVVPIT